MRLYAVTDRAWLDGRRLEDMVADAIAGGATFIQLREKHAPKERVIQLARALMPICRAAGVPFVIDDEVEIARQVGADGVHVGQSDTACAQARRVLGENAIIGVSAQTVEQALAAQAAGADYLGVGAAFVTGTKTDAKPISRETIRAITAAVDIPVVAIGGISHDNILELKNCGLDGVAVVSALFAQADVKAAAEELLRLSEEIAR